MRRACATLLLVAGAALLQRSSVGSDLVTTLCGSGLVLLGAGVFVHARMKGWGQLPRSVDKRYAAGTLADALPE